MQVPLVDLRAQYIAIKNEIDEAISDVISNGDFILGSEVKHFEEEIAAYCGASHAVGVASGTDALNLALLACGIGHGDEVITTPFTFIATVEAIAKCGATPVFVDIDPKTYNIDPIAFLVWIQCDGKTSLEQMTDIFSVDGNRDIVKAAIKGILEKLNKSGLVK